MYWVLQDNMFHEDGFRRLKAALERLEIPHSTHRVIPFIGEITDPPEIPDGMPVVEPA